MKRLKAWQILFLLFLTVATVWILAGKKRQPQYENEGKIFGTTYHVKYEYSRDLDREIVGELKKVDASLSIFNETSTISRINRNESLETDSLFREVFGLAEQVTEMTGGAFDITVAPLVNAWGFGFRNAENVNSEMIDSLLLFVGHDKIRMQDGQIVKADPRVMLDCGAIAKGFGVDRVARMFDRLDIRNYMVEIGGEVVCRGHNAEGKAWSIGVSKPVEEGLEGSGEVQTVLKMTDKALATSGNYRNFYYREGKRYAHTIHPKTGWPVRHKLLSASVLAPDCATADAYATAFMVTGMEEARSILKRNSELEAYFIYEDEAGRLRTWMSSGMRRYVEDARQEE